MEIPRRKQSAYWHGWALSLEGQDSSSSPDPWVTAGETLPTTVFLSLSSMCDPPGTACNICPKNWLHFQQKCYYFGKGSKQWIQARFACSDLQGRLVSIHSQKEQVLGLWRPGRQQGGSGWGELAHRILPWPSGMDGRDHIHLHLGLPDATHQQEGFLDWPPGSQYGGRVCMVGREPCGL